MKKFLFKVLYILAAILIWWLYSKYLGKSLFVPTPSKVWTMIVNLFETNSFFKHLGWSFFRVTAGVVIAAVISIPVGMLIAWFKPVKSILGPLVDSSRYIPPTCFSSMLMLYFGIGEQMKISFIAIAALLAFLPTVIQTCSEPLDDLKETAYTMGFSYTRMLWYCFIPYVMPSLLQSFITLYGVGWTYVIIAELNNTQYGLGHLMHIGAARGRTDMAWAGIVIVVAVSYIFDKLASMIVRKLFKWRFEANG